MKRPRVLIVDDSSVMRKIVERSLRQAGLDLGEVVEAGNGIEALAAVREGAFDLILSDINMPAMDGLEFLRQLPPLREGREFQSLWSQPKVANRAWPRRCRLAQKVISASHLPRHKSRKEFPRY